MIVLLSILLFLVLACAYFLFAPLVIEIDSMNGLYRFSIVPVFRVRWITQPFPGYIEMKIFGLRKKIGLKKNETPEKAEIKKKRTIKIDWKKTEQVLRSFRVKKCHIDIDTGDMATNGELFPLFYLLSRRTGKYFAVNFTGKSEIILEVSNNSFRMLKSYITS